MCHLYVLQKLGGNQHQFSLALWQRANAGPVDKTIILFHLLLMQQHSFLLHIKRMFSANSLGFTFLTLTWLSVLCLLFLL